MKFRAYDFLAKFNSTDLSEQNFVPVAFPSAPKILKVAKVIETIENCLYGKITPFV